MRDIKFRAWHNKHNTWLHNSRCGCDILGETILLGGWCNVPLDELNDIAVEQFTGLKDVNGIDIYEGDIMQGRYFLGNLLVIWDEPLASFELSNDGYSEHLLDISGPNDLGYTPWKIIGNIHDNPDLLK